MRCHECIEQLSAYMDHMLTPDVEQEVQSHLIACDSCRKEYQFLQDIVDGLHTLQQVETPENLHQNIMKRIKKESQNTYTNKISTMWTKSLVSVAAVFITIFLVKHFNNTPVEESQMQDMSLRSAKMSLIQVSPEVWELNATRKKEILQVITNHTKTYQIQVDYLPDEDSVERIVLYQIVFKDELLKNLQQIEMDIMVYEGEGDSADVEIFFR